MGCLFFAGKQRSCEFPVPVLLTLSRMLNMIMQFNRLIYQFNRFVTGISLV